MWHVKTPRERWQPTEWWPLWFSDQKIDFYLNPEPSLFELRSAWDKIIQFRVGVFLVCVRCPFLWIDRRVSHFLCEWIIIIIIIFLSHHIWSDKDDVSLWCVTIPPGYYNHSVPQWEGESAWNVIDLLFLFSLDKSVHSLQLWLTRYSLCFVNVDRIKIYFFWFLSTQST